MPARPWRGIFAAALAICVGLTAAWEYNARRLELVPGDMPDDASAWAEQRRRVDAGDVEIAIVGDSRILFDTDLAHFAALTGIEPVQLALPGTNGRPFLEDLAADPDFHGLAIVGITEMSYFREAVGLMADALGRHAFEAPSQRSALLLERALNRVFAFLDPNYRLSRLLLRLDPGVRTGARGPYDDVWKIATVREGRQFELWTRIEHDLYLREHARAVWSGGPNFAGPPIEDAVILRTQELTRAAVASIRARGGEVVFVRPPSAASLRANEERRLSRARGWDALLASARVVGVHADDYAAMRGLDLPEDSHLSSACARVFTDAYVRAVAALTPRLPLLAAAPRPLAPADCTRAVAVLPASGR